MAVFRLFLLSCLTAILVGCQTRLAGDYYDPPMAKNPMRLQLSDDGIYLFGPTYATEGSGERGRWWRVNDVVVMLVPDDAGTPQWFARAEQGNVLRPLQHSTDFRDVMNEPIQ